MMGGYNIGPVCLLVFLLLSQFSVGYDETMHVIYFKNFARNLF